MVDGVVVILNFQDRIFGFDDLIVNHSVDVGRDVVFGNDFLLGNIGSSNADVDFDDALDDGDDKLKSRLEGVGIGT